MELVATGWCTSKWLRLNETIRNLTSGDLEIALMVIQLGETRLKKKSSISLTWLTEWGRRDTAT